MLKIKKIDKKFKPDSKRVIIQPHIPKDEERIKRLIKRVLSMPEENVEQVLNRVVADFAARHKNIEQAFDANYDKIKKYIPENTAITNSKKQLLGAYFSMEYSLQSAAFCNPSIVPHPDQSGVETGCMRFIMSFRSVGEGHISSIEFRSGCVDGDCQFIFDEVSPYAQKAEVKCNYVDGKIFCEYGLEFQAQQDLSERIIFPVSKNESNGIEDARFVRFVDDDGSVTYYATYTAYDGSNIYPQLIETKDFVSFKMSPLTGKYSQNKGMALFPRKINGKYAMVSRVDGENLFIMESDNIYNWDSAKLLKAPESAWEFVQIGNCGSPIETEYGWVLLTHGVGPMRQYCIGITLLDIEDPSKIVNNMTEPLIIPDDEEREGYVPNVVYTCGAIVHNGNLIIPYAMSDTCTGIATLSVRDLFSSIETKKEYAKST